MLTLPPAMLDKISMDCHAALKFQLPKMDINHLAHVTYKTFFLQNVLLNVVKMRNMWKIATESY